MAKLEQVGLVIGSDVEQAIASLEFRAFPEDEADPTNSDVYLHNSNILMHSLWNLLVVKLWVGLCQTFDAGAELRLIQNAGLTTQAGHGSVSPPEWSRCVRLCLSLVFLQTSARSVRGIVLPPCLTSSLRFSAIFAGLPWMQ